MSRYIFHVDTLIDSHLDVIDRAITEATVTGSVGATAIVSHHRVQPNIHATVARIDHSNAWRVTAHSNANLTGLVRVRAGAPGRFHTHSAN